MTITNVTPTGDTNQTPENPAPIDNNGQPINPDGTPRETTTVTDEKPSYESIEQALKDTKAELTRLQQAAPKEPVEAEKPETDTQVTEAEAVKAGVDIDKVTAEYNNEGKLSDETYKELAEKGFPKDLVDSYIAGQHAKQDLFNSAMESVVGGSEKLDEVIKWAGSNLPPEQIAVYNESLTKGTAAAKLALEGIYSQFKEANGNPPSLLQGGTQAHATDIFRSSHEMTKAMQDKRYWTDPDYQKDVQAKAERSMAAGTI